MSQELLDGIIQPYKTNEKIRASSFYVIQKTSLHSNRRNQRPITNTKNLHLMTIKQLPKCPLPYDISRTIFNHDC